MNFKILLIHRSRQKINKSGERKPRTAARFSQTVNTQGIPRKRHRRAAKEILASRSEEDGQIPLFAHLFRNCLSHRQPQTSHCHATPPGEKKKVVTRSTND
ncbi:hypothetical protein BaRGS_00015335 [Batillaria attramentaria]|uniref:Uncharacterized protein n=1 Tax=Batillaria attramentaria TaxID=370345 RepID=A0ABD0L2T7_9CAEN